MKKLFTLVLAAVLALSAVGCGGNSEPTTEPAGSAESTTAPVETASEPGTAAQDPVSITVGIPKAPPALPVLHMLEEQLLGENVTINLDVWTGPEQLIAMVQDAGHDFFAFPLTVVAKLYNSGVPVRLMNVNTWGVTYFMTSDPDFKTWEDLRGKTVYVPLQSSPPDALTQYFLDEAGLEVGKDVEIVYATTPEVSALLASGEAVYGTLIEPQCTVALSKNENLRRALSFEDEWQRTTGTDTMIPNAGFGTTQRFLDAQPELAAAFQKAYAESVQWVLDHPAEAGELAAKYLDMPAPMVAKAIPNMGLTFKTPQDAREELTTFYNLLNDFDAKMIGGKLPDDGMFYAGE